MRVGKRTRMLCIIADKARARRKDVKGVGVVRDKEVKLEDVEASHTLGGKGGKGVPKERKWREGSAAKAELVLVVLRMLNS